MAEKTGIVKHVLRVRRATDPGGVHENLSTNRPPLGQFATTTSSPESSNTGVIVAGIVVPAVLIGVGLFIFYVWYRRKYPVRMVVGKDFAKFSNPKYVNKRGSTMTLVREDAESAWDIPDSPKQREHSLSLVKENETENESDKKNEVQQADAHSDTPPPANTEVNVGIEIVPPPRNIARERPKKAKLVTAIDLVDELSDSAFETVTESDLGTRTDSDMSSGNDSTETHTVSLGFKETFDNRHRNTVSVVTDTFDSLASGRAEHRTSSLPPEIHRHVDIPDAVMKDHFVHLSKSMDSEIANTNKEFVDRNIKHSIDNMQNFENITNTALARAQVDIKEQSAETDVNPFETTSDAFNVSDIVFVETEELPKTPSVSPNESLFKIIDSSFSDLPQNSDPFVPGIEVQNPEPLNDVQSSVLCKQDAETEDNTSVTVKQSNEDDIFGDDMNSSKNVQEEPIRPESDLSLMSAGQNNPMDIVDGTDIEWQFTTTEPTLSGADSLLKAKDNVGTELHTNSAPPNKETSAIDSVQLSSDILFQDSLSSPANAMGTSEDSLSSPLNAVETSELSSMQNDTSIEKMETVSVKSETDIGTERNDQTDRQVTRTGSLTLSKDNLFFDAPPTPMIIVHDSFIRELEPANPFLAVEENEYGLPVITEKSDESQSSTRSNSFDFDLIPDIDDSKISSETHNFINELQTVETNENMSTVQNVNAVYSEKDSINVTDEANASSENDKMSDKEEGNVHMVDSNLENSNGFDSFETKESGLEDIFGIDRRKLPEGEIGNLQSEILQDTEKFDAFAEGHSEFRHLLGDNSSPTDKKECAKIDNVDDTSNSWTVAPELNKDENGNLGGSQLDPWFPQQLTRETLLSDEKVENVDNTNDLICSSAAAVVLTEDENASTDVEIFDSFIKPESSSDRENFQPLEIQVDLPEKQPQLLNFDDFEGDNGVSVTSPTGISTDSSGISWELISETSPNIVDTNPFQIVNNEIANSGEQLINTVDANIILPQPSNLLDFEADDTSQMQQQVSLLDFGSGDNFIPADDRKTSDSSSSKEGDTSWEVIDESADVSNNQILPNLGDNNDDNDESVA